MAESDTQRKPGFLSRPQVRRIIGFAIIAALALIFIFQNTATVRIRLLVPEVTMPLWGALLIAWILGLLATTFTIRRRQ
ncbi:MAG: hypothetical protein ACRDP8_18745 [Actinopolymorphaceae bacterium]